ncbi:Hop1p [Sporobolomyces salmoneus]|uniref:Hop1p n=1 Tax=Sporobolomyces salmoneus TaxID=183962 RepID=UPI00317ECCCB
MAQRIRPLNQQVQSDQLITSQSSLQQVKTLLHAGIGCIAFLRGLFDEDSFEDAKLEAPRPTDTIRRGRDKEKSDKPSTVRIKKLKRGGCESANKLLDWIELGVTDGIEKGYLHRLVFAIYLDPEDPTNLVESYTFTFTYETDEQGNRRAAMTMHDQMKGMVISSSSASVSRPREEIHKEGDVKRQVQQVIKNLLTSTQLLDELPRRRFFTLRAFWYDETPDDYQPPGFKRITQSWPDYNLTTTSINDPPETSSLGSIQTGYHGVSIHTVTISHILETSFDDTITKAEATERNQREAAARPVLWDAETLVESVTDADDAMKVPQPLGIKDERGQVVDIGTVIEGEEFVDLRKKVGIESDPEKEVLAKGLANQQALIDSNLSDNENLRHAIAATSKQAPTGNESVTQEDPVVNRHHSYKSPVPQFAETLDQAAQRVAQDDNSFQVVAGSSSDDVEMGGTVSKWTSEQKGKGVARGDDQSGSSAVIQSQILDFSQRPQAESNDTIMNEESSKNDLAEPDTIQTDTQPESHANAPPMNKMESIQEAESVVASRKVSRQASEDEACECGDSRELGVMVCCSSCESWRHNACYGYSEDSDSVPDIFTCYRCRAHAAASEPPFDDARKGEIEHALADLKSLTLFRRAIALVCLDGVVDSNYLAKNLKIDKTTASQVLKRLKAEEFIIEKPVSKSKGVKSVAKKVDWVVNASSKQVKYKDSKYFSPGQGVERPILALLTAPDTEDIAEDTVQTARSCRQLSRWQEQNSPLFAAQTPIAASRILVPATPSPAQSARAPSSASSRRPFDREKTLQTLPEEQDEDADSDASSALSDISDSDIEESRVSVRQAQSSVKGAESTPRNTRATRSKVPTSPKKPKGIPSVSTASPSLNSTAAQISKEEDHMEIDSDPITPQLLTPLNRTNTVRPTSTTTVATSVSRPGPPASMPNLPPSKRPAPQDDDSEEEGEGGDGASPLEGVIASMNGSRRMKDWKKVKKQKASESEENLEAE